MNGILALGAMAFTVPLVIHLLFRSRFRTLDWGAMHLLEGVVRINRRRLQLLHLLLLLLRCAIPVLLAFCLARPVLTGFQALPGDAPQSLVIAIDDSRSMSARDQTGLTRMDRVKYGLTEMLENLSRRDEVIVLPSSRAGEPASASGAQEAIGRLRELTANHGPVDLATLLRGAVEAAEEASHPQRRILVVGDFPSHAIEDASMSSLSRLSSALQEKPIRPVISFWNLGVNSKELENVSVESIEIDSPAVVAGRGASFSATLRNASDLPVRDLRVIWSMDGNEQKPTTVTIAPRSTVTARWSHRIEEVGVHPLTVAIEHADALIEDNRRSIAVDVIDEIRVTLVDGQPSRQPLEGETDFLSVALSPFAFGGEDQPDAVRTHIIRPNQIDRELREQAPEILVLANIERLRGEDRKSIARFVSTGGALVVFDGDQLDEESYNEPWQSEAGTWNLPARLGPLVGQSPGENVSALPIGSRNPVYSAWNVLGDADQQPLTDVDIYRYRQLSPLENRDQQPTPPTANNETAGGEAMTPEPPLTLWSMASGDPLVVWAKRGRGRVVQFAIPCDTAWSTLPLRMAYLPMMQQLVLDLAGSRTETTVEIGEGFSVPTSELAGPLPEGAEATDAAPTYFLEPPGSPEVELKPTEESSPQLIVTSTEVAGPYRLIQSTPLANAPAHRTSTLRMVEVPAIESQLRDADEARLAAAAELVEANVYTELETLQSDDRSRRFGREIWRWLLVALLVVLVAELLLQQRTLRGASNSNGLGAA